MSSFLKENPPSPKASDGQSKNFFAIIIGAVIIGGFLYFGIRDSNLNPKQAQVEATFDVASTSSVATDAGLLQKTDSAANTAACGASDNTIVTKVIDGDTVVVEGGEHLRLLGTDADEKGYPCYDAAKTRLEELVLGKIVKLEKDKTDLDQYGRCLRYIFINNTNVDVQFVKEGLAIARFYEPDVKYKTEITAAEQYAQQNKIGCKWVSASQTAQ